MNRRFDGAITTADEPRDSSAPPPPDRPRRPILLEIASAILIVGGMTSLVGSCSAVIYPEVEAPPTSPLLAVFLSVNLMTIIVGLLVRAGRAWILCINVVAIALFLELTALTTGSAVALLFVVLEVVVLFALFRHRWWFEWQPPQEEGR